MSKWKLMPEEPTEEILSAMACVPDNRDEYGPGKPRDRWYMEDVYTAAFAAASSPPAPAKDGMSESCQVCGGNDKDVPCAYPSEEKLGCFRDSRLNLISERERNLIAAGWNYLSNHSPENGRKLEEALAAYERKEE